LGINQKEARNISPKKPPLERQVERKKRGECLGQEN